MSIRVMADVWASGPDDQAECLVLLALADIADDAGVCWPSMATIAQRARMSERNARRVIRRLEDSGWLSTDGQRGRNHTNRYMIGKPDILSGISEGKPDMAVSGRTNCPGGQNEHLKPDIAVSTKPDIAVSADPSRTTIEPSNKSKAREALCSVLSEEVADAYIAHRRAKRAILTDHAAALIAKKLAGCPDPDAVVNDSIANGWTGVFPEKSKPPPRPTTDLDAAFAQFGLPPMRTTQ